MPYSVSNVSVTASAADSTAAITVNGATVVSGTTSSPIHLNVGSNTISIVLTAQDGTTKTYTITVTRAETSSGTGGDGVTDPGGNGGGGSSRLNDTFLPVVIDGTTQQAIATAMTSEQDGQTVLTAILDAEKLAAQLEQAGDRPVVIIPVTTEADQVTAVLTGDAVKEIENKQAVLVVQTLSGSYKLPASEVLIDQLSAQLGAGANLVNITVHIDIAKSDNAKIKLLENASDNGGYTVVVPPVDFTVTAEFGDQTLQVSKFNSFVEREIPLPDGVDAGKITTAVVLNEDGTTRSVPTKVDIRDGVAYAVINSLTNSTYSVVWNPVAFQDVEQHWAKASVNNMGSRMVINGIGGGLVQRSHCNSTCVRANQRLRRRHIPSE